MKYLAGREPTLGKTILRIAHHCDYTIVFVFDDDTCLVLCAQYDGDHPHFVVESTPDYHLKKMFDLLTPLEIAQQERKEEEALLRGQCRERAEYERLKAKFEGDES